MRLLTYISTYDCVYMQIGLTCICQNLCEWMNVSGAGRFTLVYTALLPLLVAFPLGLASLFSSYPPSNPPFLHPSLDVGWKLLRNLEVGVEDIHSQLFSWHVFISHPSDPIPIPTRLPAPCLYLPVLWCHLISSHMMVLRDKHGLVCLITGLHGSVRTGQEISVLQCLEFRNAGFLGT